MLLSPLGSLGLGCLLLIKNLVTNLTSFLWASCISRPQQGTPFPAVQWNNSSRYRLVPSRPSPKRARTTVLARHHQLPVAKPVKKAGFKNIKKTIKRGFRFDLFILLAESKEVRVSSRNFFSNPVLFLKWLVMNGWMVMILIMSSVVMIYVCSSGYIISLTKSKT